jgi:hypothetical protein
MTSETVRGAGLLRRFRACLPAVLLALAANTPGAVLPEEVARLAGAELTPVGAERAGNADGTIPPWTGGLTGPIPGYEPGKHHVDPFAEDEVRFSITAQNLDQHSDKLTEGQKALLRAYPETWRINVYPTRRSAAYPDFVYEAFKTNAQQATLITDDRGGVENSVITSPFPIPKQAVEILWNHNLRWRGIHITGPNGMAPLTRRGNYTLSLMDEEITFPYAHPGNIDFKVRFPNILAAYKQKLLSPGFQAGAGRLVIESLNHNELQRQSWLYSPTLRRIVRTPFAGYDNPEPNTDALRFNDEVDMYNGSPALFEWTLLGKREIYIPYNAYQLHSAELDYDDILQPRHINPDHARYELHRVWVVEGRVKVAQRNRNALRLENRGHVYSRRVFYLDEDSWQIAAAENYDQQGELWRYSEGHPINYYQVPVQWYTLEIFHDLRQRRYLAYGLNNKRRPVRFDDTINPLLFGPNALDFYVR